LVPLTTPAICLDVQSEGHGDGNCRNQPVRAASQLVGGLFGT
jgi:hypothetical protein